MQLSADSGLTMSVNIAGPAPHPRRAEPARGWAATLDQAETANAVDGI